jgi:hypothetical protein
MSDMTRNSETVSKAEWIYADETGKPALKVERIDEPDGGKRFSQYRSENGQWIAGLNGAPRLLYNLPAVSRSHNKVVWLTEGEKCADALISLGLVATTKSGGASRGWEQKEIEALTRKTVYILPDNDEPGRKAARKAVEALYGVAAAVHLVELDGLPEAGDVVDWLAAGGTREKLQKLARESKPVKPEPEPVFLSPPAWDLDEGTPPRIDAEFTRDDIRACLDEITVISRDEAVGVLLAVKHAGGSLADFMAWRKRQHIKNGHTDDQKIKTTWEAAKPTGAANAGKLLALARQSNPDFQTPSFRKQIEGEHGHEVLPIAQRVIDKKPLPVDEPEEAEDPVEAEPAGPSTCPPHLNTIPGVLGLAVEYFHKSNRQYQPQFAVLSILSFAAVCLGRRWCTEERVFASFYGIAVGPSGCGKEHVRRVPSRLAEDAGLFHLIGPPGYQSATGVVQALRRQPAHLAIVDEFGIALKNARERGQNHKAEALREMMSAFSNQDGAMRLPGYAGTQLKKSEREELEGVVRRPSLTFIGLSTPSTLDEALTGADIASGFVNRFLIVRTEEPELIGRKVGPVPLPVAVREWAQFHAAAHGGSGPLEDDMGPDSPPVPIVLPMSREADSIYLNLEKEMQAIRKKSHSEVIGEILIRCVEISKRIGLIVTRSLKHDEVSAEAANWSVDFVRFHFMRMAALAPSIGQGAFAALVEKVGRAVTAAGKNGLTNRDLAERVRAMRNLPPAERAKIMQAAQADYGIAQKEIPKKGAGRPRNAWVKP